MVNVQANSLLIFLSIGCSNAFTPLVPIHNGGVGQYSTLSELSELSALSGKKKIVTHNKLHVLNEHVCSSE